MYRIQFNPKLGGCPKSDHAKMLVFIGIYSVFRGSVDHGGGSIYIYIYMSYNLNKLLVSPLISPIVVPYIIPYLTLP